MHGRQAACFFRLLCLRFLKRRRSGASGGRYRRCLRGSRFALWSAAKTAEMPGVYAAGCFDVAGFAVGVAEKKQIIKPEQVQVGDIVIGVASSGPHSNGYSLISPDTAG